MSDTLTMRERYARAETLDQFVSRAVSNADLWRAMVRRADAPSDLIARAQQIPQQHHLFALLEDWCGDAVNTIPVLNALASAAPRLSLRVLERDKNLDLMDAHLSPSGARSIPVVLVLDGQFVEQGWWGSRPRPLEEWVATTDARALSAHERYKHIRAWYARDKRRTALAEILEIIERRFAPALGPAHYIAA